MEHERCYVYAPPEAEDRPSKRLRTENSYPHTLRSERLDTFREMWSQQEDRIHTTLEEADQATQKNIVNFVSESAQGEQDGVLTIPTGLIVAGPSIASHGRFFERLGRRINESTESLYLVLTSSEAPNLKTLLKNLIRKATSLTEDDDDDDEVGRPATSRNGSKLLDFDLGHLQEWRKRNRVRRIIVAIQDSEAFDTGVLVELVDLLHSWLDRLPFVLLVGIATSVESFEDRLAGNSLRYLEGQKFDVTQSDEIIEKLFSVTIAGTDVPLRIGSGLSRRILERQRDHVQNVQDFSDSLKYAYMSHFYANYTSVFLKKDLALEELPTDAFEAVRNLPSFRRFVEGMLDNGEAEVARELLDSDPALFEMITQHIQSGTDALNALRSSCVLLFQLRDSLQMTPRVSLSSIWIRAASGEMLGSPLLRETMLLVKKMPSDKFSQLLDALSAEDEDASPLDIETCRNELADLVKDTDKSTVLRTQHDVRNDSLRTTVVAQKVLLSKHKAALSEQDKAYSELINRFHEGLEGYFSATFIDPRAMFLSELLVFDLKSPHMEAFQPKPRFAIERALASPHDYLGCECCVAEGADGEVVLSATQPATAILYQLYLESGTLINVSDLWSAFSAIAGENEENESKTMALFQRALAELKYLGLIKTSRKKTDHVAKTMWKGL